MSYPTLEFSSSPVTSSEADAIVIALAPVDGDGAWTPWTTLDAALRALNFSGAPSAITKVFVPEVSEKVIIAVGTGVSPDAATLRAAVGAAVRTTTGFAHLAIWSADENADALAMASGALWGGYRFDSYKANPAAGTRADRLTIHVDTIPSEQAARAIQAEADAAALVKDLVHTPAEWLAPQDLAERAQQAVENLPVSVEILNEGDLAERGFGGILGVGQGSDRPPRVVRMEYAPANAQRHVALVGKGITFDTGGLSLKPAASMVGMKFDMAGAATVLGTIQAAAAMELPVHVTAWLCITDNMPSGRALRPGDVVRMLDGQSVEVLNTDAEGRLVLGDGLVAASAENPDVIIDVATLTGAIGVALGNRHTGVMGSDDAVDAFLAAANGTGELAWPLPLPEHMEEELDSPIADMRNAKIGDPLGGSLFAGLFLRRFVGHVGGNADADRIPWIHLDIAYSAEHKGGGFGFTDKGPTAAPLRSLLSYLSEG